MVVQARPTTLAEFMALPDDGNLHEFVRGEVRVEPPPQGDHGLIETDIVAAIARYLDNRAQHMGWEQVQGAEARRRVVGFVAGGAFGLRFSRVDDPAQIRGADGVYVPAAQYARVPWDHSEYFPAVPALEIEVISPSETAADVGERVQDYRAGGARRVWCVYPSRRAIHVHDAGGPTRVLRRADTLTDEELLPGFALPLSYLFSAPPAVETAER